VRSFSSVLSIVLSLGLITVPLTASAQVMMTTSGQKVQNSQNGYTQFTPNPQKSTRINYDTWDSLLEEMVLYSGPSDRRRMSTPQAITGSLIVRGHKSAYRLEGNRIPYSQIAKDFAQYITEYRRDLEEIGTRVDISSLAKNEQLAFWLNLHNVAIIEQISKAYPLKRPNAEKISSPPTLLNDAKILKINNTPLSLRDIREKIVYPNWKNPKVIYGFYLGDIGSPSIQNTAFTADNLSDVLDRSAIEFTNSLRGFQVRGKKQYVSKIYQEVAPFYFPNFDEDIYNHVRKYMRDDVKSQLNNAPFDIDRYDSIITDLTGGQGVYKSISPMSSVSGPIAKNGGRSNLDQYIQELVIKRKRLEREGLITRGTVIIEDIETNDGPYVPAPDIDIETDN